MDTNINFQNYLIQNEKWLAIGNEAQGEHETDGNIDNDEVLAFFSSSHINLNKDYEHDNKISQKDFNDWYKANEEAITLYYDSIGLGADAYNNKDYRAEMRDSMLEFVNECQTDRKLMDEWFFTELEAEQLGLVDEEGIIGTIPNLNRDDSVISFEDINLINKNEDYSKQMHHEALLRHWVDSARANNEADMQQYKHDIMHEHVVLTD